MVIRRIIALCATTATLLGAGVSVAGAHPLHTTMSELTVDAPHHVVRVVVRAFADDYLKAVAAARKPRVPPAVDGAESLAYLQGTLVLDDNGNALTLRSCGVKTSADLVWLCVEASLPAAGNQLHLRNALLVNLFDDQVNIVRATSNGATRSLLFVRGDGAKPLV